MHSSTPNTPNDATRLGEVPSGGEAHFIQDSSTLLTWNRFDLAIKLAYLSNRTHNTRIFSAAYKEHIRAFSLGSFTEPGDPEKDSIDRYLEEFSSIYESIRDLGFDKGISLIPLATDGSILNGAHRVSSAILLGCPVSAEYLPISPSRYDWRFFKQRGLSPPLLDLGAVEFVRHSSDTYIAILWPRSASSHANMARMFDKVVYEKTIDLTSRGIHNLISICYRGEAWLGDPAHDFPGSNGKLAEVIDGSSPLRVVAFQAPNLKSVTETKDRLRAYARLGKHSLHITDSMQEAREISSLLFNEHGVHFLNYSRPNRFRSLSGKIGKVKKALLDSNLPSRHLVVDSSLVLELYGVRPANDIDVLVGDCCDRLQSDVVHIHDAELTHHREHKAELIYNPSLHFEYQGIKFVSFSQVYKFKNNRYETKDALDIAAMSSMVSNGSFLLDGLRRMRAEAHYQRSRLSANFARWARRFRIYQLLRRVKHRLVGKS